MKNAVTSIPEFRDPTSRDLESVQGGRSERNSVD